MNKRNFTVALFALFFIVTIQAQLLWKVSGNGLTKPSYLFGTHHLIEKEQIQDFDKILALAGQADAVVGEMDMSNMLSLQLKMLKGVMMKDTTIKDLMSESDYKMVEAEFKLSMNMNLKTLGHMKPMMLSSLYTIMIYTKMNKLKKQPEGVDILFQKRAHKDKKQVIGLETIEQQMDLLFNSIPLKRQADMLVKGVKEKDKGMEGLKKLNEAYLSGDLKKIETLNTEDDDMTPEEKKMMIENRNDNWIKKLTILIPAKSCFVAVGCLHLVGEKGLIEQLKKAGYTVEGVDQL
ncbi:MAG: TraB/GumN family protein [Paludibacter sp.]|nr:TraB/GumN family protein [Paludibacter sp.]